MRITFFVPTVIGYVSWPQALLARGLASALADRGHDIRVVEPRRNAHYAATLRSAGSTPARQFFDDFQQLQHHTYEPQTGSHLLEWVSREIALIDVAVAVDGIEPSLAAWLANLTRTGLARVWLSFSNSACNAENIDSFHLELFDVLLSPQPVDIVGDWRRVPLTIAEVDRPRVSLLTPQIALVSTTDAALAFERALTFAGESGD